MESTSTLMLSDGLSVLDLLVQAGMTPADVEKMRRSRGNAMAGKMLGIARGGYESIGERLARRIMGENLFGRDEWSDTSTYGASFTSKQSKMIARFPYSEALLDSECLAAPGKSVAEACFAFLGADHYNGRNLPEGVRSLPLSIMQWQQIHPEGGQPQLYNYGSNCWYPNEEFANKPTCEFRWYLALREIVAGSPSTSWENMQGMIPNEYYVPSPVMELTKDLLVYQKTKKYPNPNHYAATDTLCSLVSRIIVGYCYDGAVGVYSWDGCAKFNVGLSLFRKSPPAA